MPEARSLLLPELKLAFFSFLFLNTTEPLTSNHSFTGIYINLSCDTDKNHSHSLLASIPSWHQTNLIVINVLFESWGQQSKNRHTDLPLPKVIPKELSAESLAYLTMMCSVSLKGLRKLDKCMTKKTKKKWQA